VFVGLILAFVGLLLVGNEYRYNTITYTLTAVNRRWKVLASKVFVITVFSVVTSLLMVFFAPLCTIIGTHISGHHFVPQVFDVWSIAWRCVFCVWGYAMYALILMLVLRNQVGAIVTFLMVPLIGENILMQLFKHIGPNLPFTALQSVAQPHGLGNNVSSGHEALIVLAYVVGGMIIGAVLFMRRDAN
jgi:ABC-type transport system involved in multi-copper enzyme maturation permease subunit